MTLAQYEVLMPLAPWEEPSVVRASLRSLTQLQPQPQRIVVSVDGVLPSTLQVIIDGCASVPLLLVHGPGGEGVGRVLARGLKACSCELILRADADDLSCENRAMRQLSWLADHPEVIAGSSWIDEFITEQPLHVVSCRRVPSDGALVRWSRWRNPLNHPAVVFRRAEVLAVGGYRHRPGFEDYDLWLRILKHYGPTSMNNIAESLVLARVGHAHLARRRGLNYAAKEIKFLCGCAREGLLGWFQVLILLVSRVPLRLLPARWLNAVMLRLRRSGL